MNTFPGWAILLIVLLVVLIFLTVIGAITWT